MSTDTVDPPERQRRWIHNLRQKRDLAAQLGFWDDHEHWKNELKQLGVED